MSEYIHRKTDKKSNEAHKHEAHKHEAQKHEAHKEKKHKEKNHKAAQVHGNQFCFQAVMKVSASPFLILFFFIFLSF